MSRNDTSAPFSSASSAASSALPAGLISAVSVGGSYVVRRALTATYRRRTGQEPPRAADPNVTLGQALLWAVITAAALAATQVVVERAFRAR